MVRPYQKPNISTIKRACNSVAHSVAEFALSSLSSFFFYKDNLPPRLVVSLKGRLSSLFLFFLLMNCRLSKKKGRKHPYLTKISSLSPLNQTPIPHSHPKSPYFLLSFSISTNHPNQTLPKSLSQEIVWINGG